MKTSPCILSTALVSALFFSLSACKPTPRTANKQPKTDQGQTAPSSAQSTMSGSGAAGQLSSVKQPLAAQDVGLLYVDSVRQGFDILRPWEKGKTNRSHAMGVYLGNGRVLTADEVAKDATYIELSLPDETRRVPAKTLKRDEALGLAMLGVQHEKDADIFDKVKAHELGAPLSPGSEATLRTLINRIIPVQVPMVVESVDDSGLLPRLSMRVRGGTLPQGTRQGLPVLRDGRVAGLVMERDSEDQTVSVLNAELLRRFLMGREEETIVPVLGIRFSLLDDPAFRRYLRLSPDTGGLYVSKVLPLGAAEAAGLKEGDVVVSIAGIPIDALGRCKHPVYGLISADTMLRSLKPNGETLKLGISRGGEPNEVIVKLNRDAVEKGPVPEEKEGIAPRYILWGGLLFQPFTSTYAEALRRRGNGLPLPFLRLLDREKELIKEKRRDVVALTLIIPTPATLGYENLGFCIVEKVNGKPVRSFSQFADLLDEPTADGIVELSITRAPYSIYIDRRAAEASNDTIRRRAIPRLRRLEEQKSE